MSVYSYVEVADPQGSPINTNLPWTAPNGNVYPVLSNVIRAMEQQAGGDDSLLYSMLMGIGIYAVLYVVDDQSTTEQTIDEGTYTFVQQPNHIEHVYVRRDMTAEELDADQTERVDALEKSDLGGMHMVDLRVMHALAKQIQPGMTDQQFLTFITNARDDNSSVTWSRWKNWIKPVLNKKVPT